MSIYIYIYIYIRRSNTNQLIIIFITSCMKYDVNQMDVYFAEWNMVSIEFVDSYLYYNLISENSAVVERNKFGFSSISLIHI